MTNYSVPFDFDGNRFVWVEYMSEKERNICVYFFEAGTKWSYQLDYSFGHISHCRLLPNNKVVIVRNLAVAEIREIDDQFKLVETFKNIGDEVIAIDVYIKSNSDDNIENVDKPQYEKIEIGEKNKEGMDENHVISDIKISIILLDIDGNVNVYENSLVTKRFNLYDIKEIDKEYKDKHFFSMGYPYYIKANSGFYAISTDHGTFVLKKG